MSTQTPRNRPLNLVFHKIITDHQSLKTISGTLESPISEEGIDGVEESEVGWSGETVILTPLNNNFNTTYACTGKIQLTAPIITQNSEAANSTSLAPIGSFFNLLQDDEDQHYQNEKFYTATPGNLSSSRLMQLY